MASRRARAAVGGALAGLGAGLMRRSENEREDKETRRLEGREDAEVHRREGREDTQIAHAEGRQDAEIARRETREDAETARREGREDAETLRSEKRDDVQQLREEALERAREIRKSIEERNTVRSTIVDEDRNIHTMTNTGETKSTGLKAPAERTRVGEDNNRLSDKERVELLERRFSTPGRGIEKPTIDYAKVDAELRRQGRPDLASSPEPEVDENAGESTGDKYLDEYNAAHPDKADAVRAVRNATRRPGAAKPPAAAAGSGAAAASSVKAAGTREDPHKPTNQAEYDAIPAGDVYIADDGKPYRKK